VAEAAAFRSFANVYLREIDPGIRVHHALPDGPPAPCIEWSLREQRMAIRAEIGSPSLCGAQGFGRLWIRHLHEPRWRSLAPMKAVADLLGEAYGRIEGGANETARGRELELLGRILDSYGETARQLDLALGGQGDETSFIDAERSLVFGHWLHPTPKSRRGMASWQARAYGPEEAGTFQLDVFAVEAGLVRHDSARPRPAPEIALDLLGPDAARLPLRAGEVAVPMHPLQAQALLLEPSVADWVDSGRLRPLGAFGPRFTATSSLRTVYSPEVPWMAKFSLPVTLTNSLRVNRLAELEAGVAMARLMARSEFGARHHAFRILHDPAFLTLVSPDREESGFETVFRENPFLAGADQGIATLAALTAEPLPGRPSRLEALLRRLGPDGSEARARVARGWFGLYLDCLVEPIIALYDEHGIALEAHQQNTLLDVWTGWPRRGFYRDNQGFYLSQAARPDLMCKAPETAAIGSLYFDDAEIRRRLGYYLVVNQIFSVIARMGHDGVIAETVLLDDLARRFEAMARSMTGAGRSFVRSILDGPTLCTKANLRVRLQNLDELAMGEDERLYIDMPNPLHAQSTTRGEAERALAS
jgi:siderophore synthetase component